jgi:cytochrome P450
MSTHPPHDWDARAPAVLDEPIRAYDDMRRRCPVAHSEYLQWSLFRHADVMRALLDPETFSNAVSAHLSVPNGMDPPRHARYRRMVERYFEPGPIAAYEPTCRRIADEMVDTLPAAGTVEWMGDFAQDCVLRMHCAFMGWPTSLHAPLRDWTRRNQAATLAGDRDAMASIALDFDGHIRAQLVARRAAGDAAPDDATTRLLHESIDGRALADDEIVSIVRNWTVGELSTMASCLGILAHYLAERAPLQQRLREQPALLPAAIDEILRIHAPLIANRRVVTRDAEVGACRRVRASR